MKKLILILVALIVIVGAGFVIFTMSIDWNEHKAKISAQFSDLTGKRVEFSGPVSLSFLPSPNLTAQNIKIFSKNPNVIEPLAEVKSLVARLSLVPFLKGNFDVERMSLVSPDIKMIVMPDGTFNWGGEITSEQRQKLNEVEIKLDSVTLEKATVTLIDERRKINWKLDNLNAEVIADSALGPYKIDGSYVKNSSPEGFAISIGSILENVATQFNFSFTNPATQTSVRFDGSVLAQNDALNGNVIFESQRLKDFVASSFKDVKFDDIYDMPLAVSASVNSTKEKIDLSNIVVKYGETETAGNVIIPKLVEEPVLNEEKEVARPKIELAFDAVTIDLVPIVSLLKRELVKYDNKDALFDLDLNSDVIADIKAVKAKYKDQEIRDVELSFDILENEINLNKLKAVLPGNSSLDLNASIYPDKDGKLYYSAETSLSSDDFVDFMKFAGIEHKPVSAAVYKKFSGNAKFEGGMKEIKITPIEFSLDKSKVSGDVAIIRGDKTKMLILADADNINFDNYIQGIGAEEKQKGFKERVDYRFSKLGFVNDWDVQFLAKLGLGIYEKIPFDNTKFEGKIKNGELIIDDLKIGSLANSELAVEGKIRGFGKKLEFENLKYALSSKDILPFLGKFGVGVPYLDAKVFKNFKLEGIATGSLAKFATKSVAILENTSSVWSGVYSDDGKGGNFKGEISLKNPDFLKLVNSLGIEYKPKVYALGLFSADAKFNGNLDAFEADISDLNIGQNNAKGKMQFVRNEGRNNIKGSFEVNQIELERFFYNPAKGQSSSDAAAFRKGGGEQPDFLEKPFWDNVRFDYDFYNSFDLDLSLKVGKIVYQENIIADDSLNLVIKDGVAKVSNFSGSAAKGKILGSVEYAMKENPNVKGLLVFQDIEVDERIWGGQKYGLINGKANVKVSFATDAVSTEDMAKNLDAEVEFEVANADLKGWNLPEIHQDLLKRKDGDGLAAKVRESLEGGKTSVESILGKMKIEKGNYNVAQAVLKGEGFEVTANAQGNIILWDINSGFVIDFADIKNIPQVEFGYKGALANPVLEVDVSRIIKLYEDEKNEIISKRKAEEKQRIESLQRSINEAVAFTKKMEEEVQNLILVADKRLENAKLDASVEILKSVRTELGEIDKSISEVVSLALANQFDEEVVETINARNALFEDRLAKVKTDLERESMQDFKYRINDVYNGIVEVYNKSKINNAEYKQAVEAEIQKLDKIDTDYLVGLDAEFGQLNAIIDEKVIELDKINSETATEFVQVQNSTDLKQLEEYQAEISETSKTAEKIYEQLREGIAATLTYITQKVKAEEEEYQRKKREEEVKRKLEENTGKIVGAGKSMTVVRDIEEIEKAEELKEKEVIKVLDFSQERDSNMVIKSESKKEPVKPTASSNLLIKKEGEISSPSGVIIRK